MDSCLTAILWTEKWIEIFHSIATKFKLEKHNIFDEFIDFFPLFLSHSFAIVDSWIVHKIKISQLNCFHTAFALVASAFAVVRSAARLYVTRQLSA